MARNRFPKPTTIRLPLSDGEWVEVKTRLTAGEYRDRLTREYIQGTDGLMRIDMRQTGLALIVSYVVAWSLTSDGAPVPFSEDALLATDIDTFREIRVAVEAHDEADAAALSAEKNDQAGPTA